MIKSELRRFRAATHSLGLNKRKALYESDTIPQKSNNLI